jgi:DNA polymerase I
MPAIVTGDFAQQELRIAAYISQDEEMYKAFESGDFYTKTAEKMVGRPVDKEGPERKGAKRAVLGFLYGLGIAKYRNNVFKDYGIKLSEAQANKDREAFRATFPGLYRWQREYGSKQGWTTRSVLGWRRHVAPGKDRNGDTVPKYTDRINGPIQSTAGDILYLAIHKMQADWDAAIRTEAKFLVSVHDEIVLECPEESAKDVALWLHSKMREAFEEVLGPELGGPKSVEVSYGPSWGEQEEPKNPEEQ